MDSATYETLAAWRLAAIVESSDDAIFSTDLDGIIDSWNQGAQRLFGYAADEVVGRPVSLLYPADRQDEEPDNRRRVARGEHVAHYETARRCRDGSLVDVSLSVSPIKDGEGKVVGAAKIARDTIERRRAREQQKLLLREMTHRVKNLFAVAGSLVTLSARGAATPQALAASVRMRLSALAHAHELTLTDLSQTEEVSARVTTLADLIATMLSPFVDADTKDKERVRLNGPEITIGSEAVTHVALVLNELATNAAKYGALSTPTGSLVVTWSVDGDRIRLRWKERGGPPVVLGGGPESFGSLLVRVTVANQLEGEIARTWEADGLAVDISMLAKRLLN